MTPADERRGNLLEAVVEGVASGMLITDERGVLVVMNQAAQSLLGGDLSRAIGAPTEVAQREMIKWRFNNPDDYETRLLASLGARDRHSWEHETVEGRALAIDCSPISSGSGDSLGHVQLLSDVTDSRRELNETMTEARGRLEQVEARERNLEERAALTNAAYQMAGAITAEEIFRRLMAESGRIAGVEQLAVLDARPKSETRVVVARGFEGDHADRLYTAASGTQALTLGARRTILCNDSSTEINPAAQAAAAVGLRALMLVPVSLAERAYGVLALCSSEPQAFGEREVRQLTELAGHAATSLGNARQFARNRALADSFQHSVVPTGLPEVPGLELAAFYRAAEGELIGGDFYDAIDLDEHRTAIILGDVSGKGPSAAATTAMVRHLIEGLSRSVTDPADLLIELNSMLCDRLADGSLVTIFMAICDQNSESLIWCNAGHPPPVAIRSNGRDEMLGNPGPPCGCLVDAEYTSFRSAFMPGDLLVLYTDGLIEARRDGEQFGEERLFSEIKSLASSSPSSLARGLYAAVRGFARGKVDDDVAIVAIRQAG